MYNAVAREGTIIRVVNADNSWLYLAVIYEKESKSMKIMTLVHVETCTRCFWTWRPKVDQPVCCPKCRSHYWDKVRQMDRIQKPEHGGHPASKYGFDQIKVGEEKVYPWIKKLNGALDFEANAKRGAALGQYMRRHGYSYFDRSNSIRGMVIHRVS